MKRAFFSVGILLLFCANPCHAQDATADTVLAQALAAGGGRSTEPSSNSFSSTGTISYNWAGEQVQAGVSIRSRGYEQLRLDATLPKGVRSWAVSRGNGKLMDVDGTVSAIPSYNAANNAAITDPLTRIAGLLSEEGTQTSYVGVETIAGRSAHHIRLLPAGDDAVKTSGRLRQLDVFIDASSFLVLKTSDTQQSEKDVSDLYPRDLYFSDYRSVDGKQMPFVIRETFGEQPTWSMQLDKVSADSALADSDFKL